MGDLMKYYHRHSDLHNSKTFSNFCTSDCERCYLRHEKNCKDSYDELKTKGQKNDLFEVEENSLMDILFESSEIKEVKLE